MEDGSTYTGAREVRRLLELDRRIVEIASWLMPSRYLNPTLSSRRQQIELFRQALQRGTPFNPRFQYLPLPREEMEASRGALRGLRFGDTEVDALLRDQVEQLGLQLDLLEARGTPRFGDIAANIYGLPDEGLKQIARKILRGEYLVQEIPMAPTVQEEDPMDAHALAEDMRAELVQMKILDWRVVVLEEMSARMSVSARHREVRIKSDSLFTREDRSRLIVHELHTHVLRACNGFRAGLLNLGMGLRDYMATEEGLASWMEQKHGLLWRSQVEVYAYRALGAGFAHELSFAETFRRLQDLGASASLAWDVTLRVKRGLEDTAIPGSFPKDYVYLQGRELVMAYLKAGGGEEELFLAKIALDQIPEIKRILARWDFAAHTQGLPDPLA